MCKTWRTGIFPNTNQWTQEKKHKVEVVENESRACLSPPLTGIGTLLVARVLVVKFHELRKTNIRDIGENPGPLDNMFSREDFPENFFSS